MGFLSTPTPAVVKLFCQNKVVKTNVGRTSSRHLARVGREAALGLAACARPMGQVREECARFAPFKRPHPARPGRASRSSCHTSSRVEVDLDSVACTPPPHGSTGIGIWQCPQLLPAARHSAGPRARGAGRDLGVHGSCRTLPRPAGQTLGRGIKLDFLSAVAAATAWRQWAREVDGVRAAVGAGTQAPGPMAQKGVFSSATLGVASNSPLLSRQMQVR